MLALTGETAGNQAGHAVFGQWHCIGNDVSSSDVQAFSKNDFAHSGLNFFVDSNGVTFYGINQDNPYYIEFKDVKCEKPSFRDVYYISRISYKLNIYCDGKLFGPPAHGKNWNLSVFDGVLKLRWYDGLIFKFAR